MGHDAAISGSGFLRKQLADGARPFLARRGVYDLLGVFPRERPALSHPLRMPNHSFPYRSAEDTHGREGSEVTQEFPGKILAAAESGGRTAFSEPIPPRRVKPEQEPAVSFPAPRPASPGLDGAFPSSPLSSRSQAVAPTSPSPLQAAPTLAGGGEKSYPTRPSEVTQAAPASAFSIPGYTAGALRFDLPVGNAPSSFPVRAKGWDGESRHEAAGKQQGKNPSESPIAFLTQGLNPSSPSPVSASTRKTGSQVARPQVQRDSGLAMGAVASMARPAYPFLARPAAAPKDDGNSPSRAFPALLSSPAEPESPLTPQTPPHPRRSEAAPQPIAVLPAPIPFASQGAPATTAFWERSYLSRLHMRRAR